jgi:hypothetical protein
VTLPWRTPDGPPVTASLLFYSREPKPVNRNFFNMRVWKPALVAAEVVPPRTPGERFTESRERGGPSTASFAKAVTPTTAHRRPRGTERRPDRRLS